jgi:hypothetical protein
MAKAYSSENLSQEATGMQFWIGKIFIRGHPTVKMEDLAEPYPVIDYSSGKTAAYGIGIGIPMAQV